MDYLKKSILEDKKSYEELGREFGCSGSNIKQVARRLGIELPHKRQINPNETFNKKDRFCANCGKEITYGKYCCNACQQEFKHKERYEEFLNHPENTQKQIIHQGLSRKTS